MHSLFLLARALLHDLAASDETLQAVLLSLLPPDLLSAVSAAAATQATSPQPWLARLLLWFHHTFSVSTGRRRQQQQQGGVQQVSQQLLACAEARTGTDEQLAVLLVALLRAVGFLARTVWWVAGGVTTYALMCFAEKAAPQQAVRTLECPWAGLQS